MGIFWRNQNTRVFIDCSDSTETEFVSPISSADIAKSINAFVFELLTANNTEFITNYTVAESSGNYTITLYGCDGTTYTIVGTVFTVIPVSDSDTSDSET